MQAPARQQLIPNTALPSFRTIYPPSNSTPMTLKRGRSQSGRKPPLRGCFPPLRNRGSGKGGGKCGTGRTLRAARPPGVSRGRSAGPGMRYRPKSSPGIPRRTVCSHSTLGALYSIVCAGCGLASAEDRPRVRLRPMLRAVFPAPAPIRAPIRPRPPHPPTTPARTPGGRGGARRHRHLHALSPQN